MYSVLAPVSRGERLITIHAEDDGFVPNALFMWKSLRKTADCHHQMNRQRYENCVRVKLVPYLRPNLVQVLDNAPYQNVVPRKVPNSNTRIKERVS
jgi:hypothetical protein